MKITKLSIFGLKGTVEKIFDFKMINNISGRNESGKTTIRDAITFVLYGKVNGTSQIDSAINNKCKQMKVIAEIEIDNVSHIIERTKTKKLNIIKVDGRHAGQAAIDKLTGADFQLFSSAFCVGDFMKFEPKERREILLRMVQGGDRSKLWTKLTGETDCPYDLTKLESSYKLAKTDLDEIDSKVVTATNKKQFIAEEISKLRSVIDMEQTDVVSTKEFEEAQATYRIVIKAEPKLETYLPQEKEPTAQPRDNLEKVKVELALVNSQEPSDSKVQELVLKMNQKKEEVALLKGSTICPTCKRPFDDLKKKEEQITIAEKVLKEIKEEGKVKHTEHVAAYKLWLNRNLKAKEKVNEADKKLLENQDSNSSGVTDAQARWSDDCDKWQVKAAEAETIFRNFENRYNVSENIRIRKDNAVVQLEERDAELVKENNKLKLLDRGKLQNAVNALGAKGIQFEEVREQLVEIHKFLPKGCKLELVEKNKTNDGIKAVFNLTYDGIPYAWLSTGKRLSIDIHFADVFTSSSGIEMMFVDNIELLTIGVVTSPEPIKQFFLAKAEDKDFAVVSS